MKDQTFIEKAESMKLILKELIRDEFQQLRFKEPSTELLQDLWKDWNKSLKNHTQEDGLYMFTLKDLRHFIQTSIRKYLALVLDTLVADEVVEPLVTSSGEIVYRTTEPTNRVVCVYCHKQKRWFPLKEHSCSGELIEDTTGNFYFHPNKKCQHPDGISCGDVSYCVYQSSTGLWHPSK